MTVSLLKRDLMADTQAEASVQQQLVAASLITAARMPVAKWLALAHNGIGADPANTAAYNSVTGDTDAPI
jgi:hypothetical protein